MHRFTIARATGAAGLAALSFATFASPALAADPTAGLFKTISTGTQGSNGGESGRNIVGVGNKTIFIANDGVHGAEPFVSTAGGAATLLSDIAPGQGSSYPERFVVAGDHAYFTASQDQESGRKLYVTDGTTAGTHVVGGTLPNYASGLTAAGDTVYFSDGNQQLYKVDPATGEAAAFTTFHGDYTEAVLPGANGSVFAFHWSIGEDHYAVYHVSAVAADGTEHELSYVDGDDETQPYVTTDPSSAASAGGRLYFVTKDGHAFSSGGTDGSTAELTDEDGDAIPAGDGARFVAGGGSSVLLITDAHVYRVTGTTVTTVAGAIGPVSDTAILDGKLFTRDNNGNLRVNALTGPASESTEVTNENVSSFVVYDGYLYLNQNGGSNGRSLYRTTGGEPVAMLTADQFPDGSNGLDSLTVTPSGVAFSATTAEFGDEVYLAPTTPGQRATLLGDVNAQKLDGYTDTSNGAGVTFGASKALFSVDDGHTTQPWVSDGTPDGTHALLPSARDDRRIGNATTFGDKALFTLQDNSQDTTGVWTTDGTADGTHQVFENTGSFAVASGSIYAIGSDDDSNFLMKSDGSGAPTTLPDPDGVPSDWYPYDVKAAGTHVYVIGQSNDDSSSDGAYALDTTTGTWARILDTSQISFDFRYAVAAGDRMFFPVSTYGTKNLWVSDGTTAGTHVLHLDDNPTSDQNYNAQVFVAGSSVFAVMQVDDPNAVYPQGHLWKIDDSNHSDDPSHKDGTRVESTEDVDVDNLSQYGSFTPGPGGLYASLGGKFVKIGTDGAVSLLHAFPDRNGGHWGLYGSTTSGGKLYFSGRDAEHGDEVWTTDGTAEGTTLLADVVPGTASADPGGFITAGGQLLFGAYTEALGSQLFHYGAALPVTATPTPTPTPTPTEVPTPTETPAPVPTATPAAAAATPTATPAPAATATPTPTPAASADTRAVPRKVESDVEALKETTKSYRYALSGSVLGAKGLSSKAQCKGKVEIEITATTTKGKGKNAKKVVKTISTVITKLTWEDGECTFDKVISVDKKKVPAGAKLQATVTFRGSEAQQPKTGKPITLSID